MLGISLGIYVHCVSAGISVCVYPGAVVNIWEFVLSYRAPLVLIAVCTLQLTIYRFKMQWGGRTK